MMRVPSLFLVFFMLLSVQGMSQLSTSNERLSHSLLSTSMDSSFNWKVQYQLPVSKDDATTSLRPMATVPDFAPKHYGFFCRMEDKAPKRKGLLPRFRLGSISHVDYLEGKQTTSPLPRDY